jgi:hypothetical protein
MKILNVGGDDIVQVNALSPDLLAHKPYRPQTLRSDSFSTNCL